MKSLQCGRSRVQTRGTPIFLQRKYKPIKEGHVAPNHWATCPLLIRSKTTRVKTSLDKNQPTKMSHVITATSAIRYGPPRGRTDCTDRYSQHPFLTCFDLAIKSRYLLHTNSIHENKYTAGIRKTRRTQWRYFRLDPSTLKIEQILIP